MSVAERPLSDYNLFDPALQESPWEFNAILRREAPVYRDPNTGLFLISSYEHVMEALGQPLLFSNRFAAAMGGGEMPAQIASVMEKGWRPVDTMLTADPPEQKRFRALVNKAFTLRRVNALQPRMEEICDELLAGFLADGRVEIRKRFAVPLPLTVISEQLGVPREDLDTFKRWSDGFVAQLGQMASSEEQVAAAEMIVEFQHYFHKTLEDRRANRRDDIISDVVHATVEGERPLDTAECLSILQQILVAGNETTASSITEGMWLLIENPEQWEKASADHGLVSNLVDEVLRLSSPTANMWRVVTEDTELAGVEIPKGAFALVRYASANRDEKVFPDPDRFDIERENANEQIAFGHGTHFCLGAQLARREMETAFRKLLTHLRAPRLVPGQELRHTPNILLRGFESLEIEFEAA